LMELSIKKYETKRVNDWMRKGWISKAFENAKIVYRRFSKCDIFADIKRDVDEKSTSRKRSNIKLKAEGGEKKI
jgi:hypothetical protein